MLSGAVKGRLVDQLHVIARSNLNSALHVQAPAKINLRLKVLGRREDGFHLLSMLNATTTLCDDVQFSITLSEGCRVRVEPDCVVQSSNEDNLITRAFYAFWAAFELVTPPIGLDVILSKKIPVGGGLGGGSSDAGATLRFLKDIFGDIIRECLSLSGAQFEDRLMAQAVRCGADVPYAYHGGWCWVRGVGERVSSVSSQPLWPGKVVIAVPPKPVATAAFYDLYRQRHPVLSPARSDEEMERFVENPHPQGIVNLLANDFERDVVSFVPEVGEGLTIARRFFPRSTSLTGSGSAFFSLVSSDMEHRIPALVSDLEAHCITTHVVAFS